MGNECKSQSVEENNSKLPGKMISIHPQIIHVVDPPSISYNHLNNNENNNQLARISESSPNPSPAVAYNCQKCKMDFENMLEYHQHVQVSDIYVSYMIFLYIYSFLYSIQLFIILIQLNILIKWIR